MKVTLTFDNGPHPVGTPIVLDTLEKHAVKATFFLLGSQLADNNNVALAQETAGCGHLIGNHTYSHNEALGLMADQQAALREITDTAAILAPFASQPRLFRPVGKKGMIGPHLFSNETWSYLSAERYDCLLWNCLTREWEREESWLEPTLTDMSQRPWSVVVLHDVYPAAMRHVDRFIQELKAQGAQFTQEFPDDCVAMRGGSATILGKALRDAATANA